MLLETLHKLPIIDDCTTFDAPSHTYTVNGIVVPRSVTAVITDEVTKQEECFEADKVIDKNLSTWRSKASSKYHELIRGKDDEEAKETIKALWDRANKLGTIMHHAFELALNGESMPTAYSDGGADDVTKEMHDFQCFRSAFSKLKTHSSVRWRVQARKTRHARLGRRIRHRLRRLVTRARAAALHTFPSATTSTSPA